jgi:hypothetical protein
MKSEEIWNYIHSERAQMAETWADLSPTSGLLPPGAKAGQSRTPPATFWPPPSRPRRTSTRR